MADDFFKQPEEPKEEVLLEEPQKIKLGEKEYDQSELNKLVSLGEQAAKIEKDYGSVDKFVTEAGRRANEIGKYKAQLEDLQNQIKKSQQGGQELTPEQVEVAKKQLNDLIGGEPITDKNFAKLYLAMREGEKLIDECTGLETEINGEDGRPKFTKDEIISYMSETGIRKPLAAYRDKYESELKAWETSQISQAKPKTMFTQNVSVGEKAPQVVKAKNIDELAKQLTEELYGPQE